MKILMLGLVALKEGFQALGHEVITCTTNGHGDVRLPELPISVNRLWQELPKGWTPDFVILTDESTHPLFLGLERLEIPVAWYAIDSHIHLKWHRAYAAAFDFLFVAQKDFVPGYLRDPSRQSVSWLPLFCQQTVRGPVLPPYEHDICFVGSIDPDANRRRYEFLRRLRQQCPIHIGTGDYFPVYCKSKMVLNQCADNDVNFRTFETMACGSLLVMEQVGNGLEDLFQHKTHCVFYERDNVEEIIDIVEYYASHDDERLAIATAGWEEVSQKHTSIHRAQSILETIEGADSDRFVRQRLSCQEEILFLLASVYEYVSCCYVTSSQKLGGHLRLARRRKAIAERYRLLTEQIHHELAM